MTEDTSESGRTVSGLEEASLFTPMDTTKLATGMVTLEILEDSTAELSTPITVLSKAFS